MCKIHEIETRKVSANVHRNQAALSTLVRTDGSVLTHENCDISTSEVVSSNPSSDSATGWKYPTNPAQSLKGTLDVSPFDSKHIHWIVEKYFWQTEGQDGIRPQRCHCSFFSFPGGWSNEPIAILNSL
jgi:hypothetical protein